MEQVNIRPEFSGAVHLHIRLGGLQRDIVIEDIYALARIHDLPVGIRAKHNRKDNGRQKTAQGDPGRQPDLGFDILYDHKIELMLNEAAGNTAGNAYNRSGPTAKTGGGRSDP